MKIFYVVDPSGTIKSSDGTKTYKVLKGSEVKEFLFEKGKEISIYRVYRRGQNLKFDIIYIMWYNYRWFSIDNRQEWT